MSCGRIVCEQERTGPCFTCGTYVFTKEDRTLLLSGSNEAKEKLEELNKSGAVLDFIDQVDFSNKATSLKDIAASIKNNSGLNKAIENKERLLDFDKNSVARSKVFDDQIDYFTIQRQNFISNENRNKIAKRVDFIVENKFNKTEKIQIDFDNMEVNETVEAVIQDLDSEHKILEELSTLKSDYEMVSSSAFIDDTENELKKNLPPPVYIPDISAARPNTKKENKFTKINSMENYSLRVQDKELEKIEDKGMCLAMRQPYASLLVAGIKKFEGRSWYSGFKGRLWIYAAQKPPTVSDIKVVETFYEKLGHREFPKQYPTGVIVGCITIEDCLPNEACLQQYPNCEIDSPYAFVCDYPIAFKKPLPVIKGGGNQIYKLEPNIHQACKKMLGF